MRSVARAASDSLHDGQERVRDQREALEVGLRGAAGLLQVGEEVAEPARAPWRCRARPRSASRAAASPPRPPRARRASAASSTSAALLARPATRCSTAIQWSARRRVGPPAAAARSRCSAGVRVAGVSGRQAQLEQDLAELVGIRALGHGALQVAHRRRTGRRAPRRAGRRGAAWPAPSRPGPDRTPAGARPPPRHRRRGRRASAPPARARESAPRRACRPRSRRAGSGG